MTTATRIRRAFDYTFNGEPGSVEQDGRIVRYTGDTLPWENHFRSVAAASSRYEGDLRAMRRNDCYVIRERED